MRTLPILVVAIVCAASAARADHDVAGFVVYGSGTLIGRATEANGKPLAGIEIHIATQGAEQTVRTDADGTYRVELASAPGEPSMVFAKGHPGARIGGATAISIANGSEGEAIEMRETLPPKVVAKSRSTTASVPPYSDEAIDRNVWVRAWVLLDIDATGAVVQVKFLKRPGYGLDPIALKAAFATRFEPARDRADRAIRSALVWSFEWPSYFWLQKYHSDAAELADAITHAPCALPGKPHADRRDCEGPDLTRAFVEAWIGPRAK